MLTLRANDGSGAWKGALRFSKTEVSDDFGHAMTKRAFGFLAVLKTVLDC